MSCQHAACAACAGPVSEGRCPTCRATRSSIHSGWTPVTLQVFVALVVLVVAVLLTMSGAAPWR